MSSSKKPTTATPGVKFPDLLRVSPRIRIPHREFQFDFVFSSGPGGQNVNRVRTKAVLHWDLATSPSVKPDLKERFHQKFGNRLRKDGVLVLSSQRTRDAHSNQKDCLDKLKKMLLEVAVAPNVRKKTRPKKAAREVRLTTKHKVAEKKKTRGRVRTLD